MPKKLSRSNSARSSGDEGTAEDDAKDPSKLKEKLKATEKECKDSAKAQREKDALAAAAKVIFCLLFLFVSCCEHCVLSYSFLMQRLLSLST